MQSGRNVWHADKVQETGLLNIGKELQQPKSGITLSGASVMIRGKVFGSK